MKNVNSSCATFSYLNVFIARECFSSITSHKFNIRGSYSKSFIGIDSKRRLQHNVVINDLADDSESFDSGKTVKSEIIGEYTPTNEELSLDISIKDDTVWIFSRGCRGNNSPAITVHKSADDESIVRLINFSRQELMQAKLLDIECLKKNRNLDQCDNPIEELLRTVLLSDKLKIKEIISSNILMDFLFEIYFCIIIMLEYIGNVKSFIQTTTGYESVVCKEINRRKAQLEEMKNCKFSSSNNKSPYLIFSRLRWMIVSDLVMGFVAVYFLNSIGLQTIFDNFIIMTEWMSNSVLDLLEWLRGAPAGLKLSQPLTLMLASFFSYHVRLWTLYLSVAESTVYLLSLLLVWSGVLGVAIQCALLTDLMHFVSIHLHCFYIYAARLHMVQVSLLGSQWRAFRGRKWNPLKQRVDSLDQNFLKGSGDSVWPGHSSQSSSRVLTAMVFTLTVFLLPTTSVYYAVFLLLKLVLSVSKGLLLSVIWVIHTNPIYILYLYVIGSTRLEGNIRIASCRKNSDLSLHTEKVPLTAVLRQHSRPESLPHLPLPQTAQILTSMLYAEDLL